jgi:hypothetical protein
MKFNRGCGKYIIGTITCALLLKGQVLAQGELKIHGCLKDPQGAPVEYATVVLFQQEDSAFVSSKLTDSLGCYQLNNVARRDYILKISHFLYQDTTYTLSADALKAAATEVSLVLANPKSHTLKEVSIVHQVPLVQRKVDRLVLDVEGSVLASGDNILNTLQILPGVMVDGNDNVRINGKDGVRIMINERPVNLTGEQLKAFLRTTPAENIKRIELITNPPAKYEAAGTAALINIELKKASSNGYHGNAFASYSQGIHSNYNGGINLNHKHNSNYVSLNYSHSSNTSLSKGNETRVYRNSDRDLTLDREVHERNKGDQHYITSAFDHEIANNQTIGLAINASFYDANRVNESSSFFKSSAAAYDSIYDNSGNASLEINDIDANLYYTLSLDTLGQGLKLNMDYGKIRSGSDFGSYSVLFIPDGTTEVEGAQSNFTYSNPLDIRIRTIKGDYVKPLGKKQKLEVGLKASFVENDSDIQYDFSPSESGDNLQRNAFDYKENINAGYLSWSKEEWGKWDVQAGVRLENTSTHGKTAATENDTSYTKVFPSLFLQRKFKEAQLNLSYSKRIQRPNYNHLIPFELYLDRYFLIQGNPSLKPMYSDSYELSYSYKRYTFTTNYTTTKDIFNLIPYQDDITNKVTFIYGNLDESRNISLTLSAPFQLKNWWTIRTNANYYINYFTSSIPGQGDFSSTVGTFYFNASSRMNLQKGYSIEAFGFYASPSTTGIIRSGSRKNFSLGVRKSFLEDRASLQFRVADIFYMNNEKLRTDLVNQKVISEYRRDTRQFSLAFSYRFSRGDQFRSKNRSTGNFEEKSRSKQ